MDITKEFIFEEFGKLKSNKVKVKYLKEIKEEKQKNPHLFRNLKISIKAFDNLIREWESVAPFGALLRQIEERKDAERKKIKDDQESRGIKH